MEQGNEALPRKRIVHSDDFVDFCTATRIYLESQGYEVRTASTAEETLELVREWPPDLIITDIMKPVMDGLEMIRRLKADDRTARIPVLVLSAWAAKPERRQAAVESGADVVFAKPIEDYPEFARVVAEACNKTGEMVRELRIWG